MEPILLSIPRACELMGNISRATMYELIGAGVISTVHIGRRVFVTRAELERYAGRISGALAERVDVQ